MIWGPKPKVKEEKPKPYSTPEGFYDIYNRLSDHRLKNDQLALERKIEYTNIHNHAMKVLYKESDGEPDYKYGEDE